MGFGYVGYKTYKVMKNKEVTICITCKNKVDTWKLKQVPMSDKFGNLKVKGICPICKQFAKWLPNSDTKYYGL